MLSQYELWKVPRDQRAGYRVPTVIRAITARCPKHTTDRQV
jgi:hypothetical protein